MRNKILIICTCLFFGFIGNAQHLPFKKVVETSELTEYLTSEVRILLGAHGEISKAELAAYFRNKFSERYFYNWNNFEKRFENYNKIYQEQQQHHIERAKDHLSKFADSTHWKLPFNYLNNESVNAYALRHLARQHKMVDIAYYYYYNGKNPKFISYFNNQLKSLNDALHTDKYEKIKDGNGVYEAFRSGYRVLNWLQIHTMFLSQESYSDEDQLKTIATLLQHGAHLYKNNQEFHAGNHQTRGLSALAMISILLRDFNGAEVWYEHSMKLLKEHLKREINEDGFQFERSVHYHMSDIGNFYYVYALAKKSNLKVEPFWEQKLESLFTTLTKIAYPDKSAPVLQDDTDNPWAEKNDISGAMTLGYLLFGKPEMGYFSNEHVEAKMFWYVDENQLKELQTIHVKKPEFESVSFPTTGYFIQREGWASKDKMMIISAGLDSHKPDHQHGDMLGVQAMANGKVILPNYQVRYSLKDYGFFKNSMVKNVALVDNELQGKEYTSNQGGSGFGKFLVLPNPKVITWNTNPNLDLFVGSHDGFSTIGVEYSRQVINIKNDFWIVKDNFKSESKHNYKQVWQGHYTTENGSNLIRSTYDDATGFDIFQLNKIDEVKSAGKRGKQWSVISKNEVANFSFLTALYPYSGFENRINELVDNPDLKDWKINNTNWKIEGDKHTSLSKDEEFYFFDVTKLQYKNSTFEFDQITDVYFKLIEGEWIIQSIGDKNVKISISGMKGCNTTIIKPGELVKCAF